MIQTNKVVPLMKELIYHIHAEDSDNISMLKAVVKVQKVMLDAAADMLESKAYNDCNIYLLQDMIKYNAVILKAYNLLFDTMKITNISNEEKDTILSMIADMNDIDDGNEIVELLNEFYGMHQQEPAETVQTIDEMVEEFAEAISKIQIPDDMLVNDVPEGEVTSSEPQAENVQVDETVIDESKTAVENCGASEEAESSEIPKDSKSAKKSTGKNRSTKK
ncbi:hypothetical protein [Ruminiclostridium josui]|uniref:hypothetical protein n=1 Tax=Ruminiclostridium josui TaxID=1499 RepID=UPI000465AD39|nr:hypothetical protein [Ruminiclostridium josui]